MRMLYNNPIPQPCKQDCTERKTGCNVTCKAWADYLAKRNEFYQQRHKEINMNDHTKASKDRAKAAIKYTKLSHKK